MKKWQWLIAIALFLSVASTNYFGDLTIKRTINKIVYSSDDLAYMRKMVVAFTKDKDEQLAVSAHTSIEQLQLFETIERFNEGVLLTYKEPFVLNALYDGLIVFTGHTRYNGKSMSVVYDNGVTVTVGFVDEFFVLPYTTVSKGTILATKKNGELYLQIEKEGVILNMEQTIKWLKEREI
ncbi:MAG: hypothetical protein ABS942_17320 [Solibacillus sp.]|uniref:hypothetical protein n=1 Tax=Solibacillus sp. FSL H8-0523 TaxID=2954511 RepID=UPI003101879B